LRFCFILRAKNRKKHEKRAVFLFLAVFMMKSARDANSPGERCGLEAVPVMSGASAAWALRAAQVPKTPHRIHVVAASGGHRNRARGRKSCGFASEGVRTNPLCGFVSAATAQAGPERGSAEPRKARFFAQQKMCPNYAL
jgi:hypothetical protein